MSGRNHETPKNNGVKKRQHPDHATFYLRQCILNYHNHKGRLREIYYEMQDTGSMTQRFSDEPKGGHRALNGTESIASRNSFLETERDELIEKINLADRAAKLSKTLKAFVNDGVSIRRYGDIHNLNYRQALNTFNEAVREVSPKVIKKKKRIES